MRRASRSASTGGAAAAPFPRGAHQAFRPIRPGHFWFETRREILTAVVAGLPKAAHGPAVEIGCGDGFVLGSLPGERWIGLDENMEDLRTMAATGLLGRVAASGKALPLRVRCRLVAALDILEHLQEDTAALEVWGRALVPGGHLVLTVPSGPELWSARDDYAGHVRRYSRAGLRQAVEAAGLRVERLRPMFRLLWPLAWLSARLDRTPVTDPAQDYRVAPPVNTVLRGLLRLEEKLLGELDVGRGTSWLLVARRPEVVAVESEGRS